MKQVIITKSDGKKGTLTLAADGKWDITVDGSKSPQNIHYTTDQVERIIEKSKANNETIEIL